MEQEPKKKKFFSMGVENWVTILAILGSGIGVYTQLYADVSNAKRDIAALQQDQARKEVNEKEARKEARDDLKEVKQDIKDLRNDMSSVLFELRKIPKPPAAGRM